MTHPNVVLLPRSINGVDINPIKNIWESMARAWSPEEYTTKESLFEYARNLWNQIREDPDYCEKLIESLPKRLEACIESEGALTKYGKS